jgi:Mn2+/Fe2+ NRAMP family transporter
VTEARPPSFFAALGPGIVFAGAAIGVSHLVQSTRAGAVYGLTLVGLVVFAHALKLPAMLFGPRYAAATGRSLVHAYREQGWHAVGAFAVIQIGTMFTIQAAVTIVTAAILKGVVVDPLATRFSATRSFRFGRSPLASLSSAPGCSPLGGYAWLDRVVKVLMVVMAVSTVAAAATQAPALVNDGLPLLPEWSAIDAAWIAFAVALVGWMPAPLDISVWHSLWSLARRRQTGHAATRRQCEVDFFVGYALCVVLALSFVVLGAGLLHRQQVEPAAGGAAFANQLVGLYADSLGDWARPLISICAIAVMVSTTITVLDAIPRTLAELGSVVRPRPAENDREPFSRTAYWAMLAVLSAGAVVIIAWFSSSMRSLVDLATTLSFIGTPILAWLNHRAMTSPAVPPEHAPGGVLRAWSVIGIAAWVAFAGLYLFTWI